jgi:hypothetical protein
MLKEMVITPAKAMFTQAANFLSALCVVIFILLIGWFVAKIIKNVIVRLLDVLRIDSYAEKAGVDKVLAKGGIKYSISGLIGVLGYWVVMLIALVIAISAVTFNAQAAGLLNTIVLYIPRVISAIFILVVGIFFASFVNTAVQTAAANAGVEQAGLLARLSQFIIIIFAINIALKQLMIDIGAIENAILIIISSIGLAFALAFGLGCKDIAGRLTQEFLDRLRSKK